MKSYSLRTIIVFVAILLAAFPVFAVQAQTEAVRDTSLFGSLREKQVENRQKIKANLRDLVTEEVAQTSESSVAARETQTMTVVENPALSFAYRLQSIAERLESHMLLMEMNGETIPNEAKASFLEAQTKLLQAVDGMTLATLTDEEVASLLQQVRTGLATTITSLKATL